MSYYTYSATSKNITTENPHTQTVKEDYYHTFQDTATDSALEKKHSN